jgi:hypothetical protein
VCLEYSIPVTYEIVDALLEILDPTGEGKRIDYPAFVKLFDWRSMPDEGNLLFIDLFFFCFAQVG